LTAILAEANVSMHECKAFACQVFAGRLEGKPLMPTKSPASWPTLGPIPDTPDAAQPEGGFTHGG
jgi:formate dehydrogenase major subunit